MNHCLKCNSLYSRPGTCNCYAQEHTTYPLPLPRDDPFDPANPDTSPFVPYVPPSTSSWEYTGLGLPDVRFAGVSA